MIVSCASCAHWSTASCARCAICDSSEANCSVNCSERPNASPIILWNASWLASHACCVDCQACWPIVHACIGSNAMNGVNPCGIFTSRASVFGISVFGVCLLSDISYLLDLHSKHSLLRCNKKSSSEPHFLSCAAPSRRSMDPRMTSKPWWREPTRQKWVAFAAAWTGWVRDASDFMVYVLVLKQLAGEFHQTLAGVSGSLTLTLLVRLMGGGVAGWMADRWGRKVPLLVAVCAFVVFDGAIYFSHSFTAILIFRTLFGFAMGAQWTAGTALAMESMPLRTRKTASGILQAGWPIGVMIAAGAGMLIIGNHGWRPMFLVGVVPALLTLPLWFMFPNTQPAPRSSTEKRSAIKELATPGVPRMLVIGAVIMSLGFIVYYGLQTQYAYMLVTELKLSADAAMAHVILFNAGKLVGSILAGVVAARRGGIGGPVPLAIGAVLGGAFGVGYSGVTPVLTTSLFPEHVRARAIGLVYHVGAFVAAYVPSLLPWLVSSTHWHLSTVIMLVDGSALVLMSAAILALRGYITPSDAPTARIEVESALPLATARELSPIASAIVAREVAKAAERRAILGCFAARSSADRRASWPR